MTYLYCDEFEIEVEPWLINEARQSAVRTGKSLTDDFKNRISRNQIQRAVEILSLFGLDKVYSEGPMPLIDGEQDLLAV